MSQREELPQATEIGDFAEVLTPEQGEDPPVVVGGHAVNFWALYSMHRGVTELGSFLPFTSKDLDLIGTMHLLDSLHQRFKGKKYLSEPRSPVIGRLEFPYGGETRIVEVLHNVRGLSPKELDRHLDLDAGGVVARVLFPHLVLKSKIGNCVGIDQKDRNDVKHVAMMIPCVRQFLRDILDLVTDGAVTQRELVNLLEEIKQNIESQDAKKAATLWGFDFSQVWPMDALTDSRLEKIRRFVQNRLL